MNEDLRELYDWALSQGHISQNVSYEAFANKLSSDDGMRGFYGIIQKAGGTELGYEEFVAQARSPKKKEQPSPVGQQPFSVLEEEPGAGLSSPNVPAPTVEQKSGSNVQQPGATPDGIAPWQQVISDTRQYTPPPVQGQTPADLLTNPVQRDVMAPQQMQQPKPVDIAQFSLTGDESPFDFGEQQRLSKEGEGYQYKKEYDSKTTMRKAKRDMANIAAYGEMARNQTSFASDQLSIKYGPDWETQLQTISQELAAMKDLTLTNPVDEQKYNGLAEKYNAIVGDPLFDMYQGGLKAQGRGYDEYVKYGENNPDFAAKMDQGRRAQVRADIAGRSGIPEIMSFGSLPNSQSGVNWALRKGAQLLGGVLSIPRTVSGALPDSWTSKEFEFSDWLGSIGDEIVENANINYPKPTQFNRPLYERVVEFEGKQVVVDDKGKFVEARNKDGNVMQNVDHAPENGESFVQRFEQSGKGNEAREQFTGTLASTLDKTLDVAADLLIYRYMGQGTKVGTMLTSMGMSHQQAYQEALEAKMSPQDAAEYAFFSSLGVGALEAYVGNIETQFAKPGVRAALQMGKKEALAAAGKVGPAQAAMLRLKPVAKEVFGENAEEVLQGVYGDMTRASYNQMAGADFDMEMDKEGLKETILLTTLVTAPMAALGMGASANQYRQSALMAAVKNPERFNALIDEVTGQAITETDAAAIKGRVARLAKYNANLPQEMADSDRAHILALEEYREMQQNVAESEAVLPAQRNVARQNVREADNIIGAILEQKVGDPTESKPETQEQVVQPAEVPEAVTPKQELPQVNIARQETFTPMVDDTRIQELDAYDFGVNNLTNGGFMADPDVTVSQVAAVTAEDVDVQADIQTAVGDRYTEAAIDMAERKGFPVDQKMATKLRDFIMPELMQPAMMNNPDEHPAVALDRLTNEFIMEQGGVPAPLAASKQEAEASIQVSDALTSMSKRDRAATEEMVQAFDGDAKRLVSAIDGSGTSKDVSTWEEFETKSPKAAKKIRSLYESQQDTGGGIAAEVAAAGAVTEQTQAAQAENAGEELANAQERQIEGGGIEQDFTAGDTVEETQVLSQEPVTPETATNVKEKAGQLIASAPVPERITPAAETAMVEDGVADISEVAIAEAGIDGSDMAMESLQGKMDAMKVDRTEELADAIESEALASDLDLEEDNVNERPAFVESGDEFIVTKSTHVRQAMRDLGGKWVNGRGWVFPMSKKESVLRALAQPLNPNREHKTGASPGIAGRIGVAMRNPGIFGRALARRAAISKGRSLQERLRIAQQEINIAADERAKRVMATAERLQKAFPNVEVVTDRAAFMAAAKVAFPNAENPPAGFVYEGKVYLDLEVTGVDTPIHEFGHIWSALTKQHSPALHARGMGIMKGSEYEAAVREDERYSGLSDEDILEEALALAIGEQGARIMNATRWQRFKEWVDDFIVSMRTLLGGDPFGLTAAQYGDLIAAKLLSGNEIFPESSAEIARIEQQARALFIGEKADLSERAKMELDNARRLEELGHDNLSIWKATNWRRGIDNKWKWEISDAGSEITKEPALLEDGDVFLLSEIFDHPDLYARYPYIGDLGVVIVEEYPKDGMWSGSLARFEGGNELVLGLNIGQDDMRVDAEYIRKVILHEVQHYIQLVEGFGIGATADLKLDALIQYNLNASNAVLEGDGAKPEKRFALFQFERIVNALEKTRREIYDRVSGEVESRNVETRANLTPRMLRERFPEVTEDVAYEEQVVLFAISKPEYITPGFEHEGEMLRGTTPVARAHFGSQELRRQATVNAAIQIIEIEIQEGSDRDRVIAEVAASLGLDTPFVETLWEQAEARMGAKVPVFDLRDGKIRKSVDAMAARLSRWAKWQISDKGLAPRDIFKDAKSMENAISAILYRMDKQAKDLDNAINEYIKSQTPRMSKRAQQDFRQHINDVLAGRAEWGYLPNEVAGKSFARKAKEIATLGGAAKTDLGIESSLKEMRATLDNLSRQLLLSGAFGKNAIVTVMENMGVSLDDSVDAPQFYVAIEALSKPPYERTDEENLLVDAFLARHQKTFGTYLTRAYRVHDYPDWRNRIPQDVWNRAKRFYYKQFSARRDELEAIVAGRDEKQKAKMEALQKEREQVAMLANDMLNEFEAKLPVFDKQTLTDTNGDWEAMQDAVDSARGIVEKMKAELLAPFNIENAEIATLDAAMGPNVQALSGLMYQYRFLNKQIADLEQKMSDDRARAAEELDIVNNNLRDLNRYMEQVLAEEAKTTDVLMVGGGVLGSKDIGITKKRKEIPPEIRALYGEYLDPTINFAQSAMKMAKLLESQHFLNKMRSRYEGVYFFRDGKQPSGVSTRISAEGNPRMAPLDGWYTTEDIAQAMSDFYNAENVAEWQRFWGMYIVNYVKLGKTILSPVTQARNFWGNVSFILANGWNPLRMFNAWKEYGAMWNGMDSTKWREYAEKLHRLGVFGESVNARDIENLRNTLGFENIPSEQYGEFVESRIMSIAKGAVDLPTKAFNVFQKAYEMGDAFYKLMGFENEKRRYARAMFGKPFAELSLKEQEEVEGRAAEIVKAVLPTYSYVPRIVKTIRRFPFTGTFVAFPAEMIRVTYNTYELGLREVKDKRTRWIGMTRLAGITAAISASAAMVNIAKSIFGYDDDEWDDANKFVADYQKNSMLMPLPRDKAGNMRYINLGYTDPFSFLSKMVNAGFDDPSVPPAARAAKMLQSVTEPFLSPELSFWTMMQLAMNVDDKGRPIRSSAYEDELLGTNFLAKDNLRLQFDFARKKLQPGLIKSGWDLYDIYHLNVDNSGRVKTASDYALAHAFGLQIERIDPKISYQFQMKDLLEQKNSARARYTMLQNRLDRQWKSLQPAMENLDEAEKGKRVQEFANDSRDRLVAQYESSKKAYIRILKDAHETSQALMRLGATKEEVRAILREQKWGQENGEINCIISKEFSPVILTFKKKGDFPIAPKK